MVLCHVAQLVEQYTFNVRALGSSPNGITEKAALKEAAFVFYHIKLTL